MRGVHSAIRFGVALLATLSLFALCHDSIAVEFAAVTVPGELRVLYAGNPGSERMQDFEIFLGQHFAAVGTADYREFQPEDAADFDVVIFDWTSIYPRDENGKVTWDDFNLAQPQPPKLDRSFARPVVMIGATAGTIGNQLQLAINWKCLCMEDSAHDVVTTHPIFQGPLPVKLEFYEQEKPLDYYLHPGTEQLGETIEVWKVQEKSFPEVDPGLVSSRENFTATPDAEVISGGINGKGPTSVAIGRHGNYLLWGFSGQPAELTDSARNAFVNAICYIRRFDGQAPGPTKSTYGGRDSLLASVYFLRSVSDEYIDNQVEQFQQMMKENPPPAEMLEQMGDDPAAYFRKMYDSHIQQVLEKLPEQVRKQCDDDVEQLIRYYDENLEYLRADDTGHFQVDEDVRRLGVSNRSASLLGKCVAMLESGEGAKLAQRVLERYTGKHYADTVDWRTWLDSSGEGLQFDENAGLFVQVDRGS